MKYRFSVKTVFLISLLAVTFGCQSQTISNSSNNTNYPATNADNKNQTPGEPKALETRNIKFESADKVEIAGTFYEAAKANSPAVLLLHQWGGSRKSYDAFAKQLQAKNFGVLAIDGRGFGESTKTTDGKTVGTDRGDETVEGMKADVDNAFQFLAKQKNVDVRRIAIVGASYGSSLAMIYAAENSRVKAAALLSPGLNYFGNLPIEEAVKNYGDRALLLVAAEDDQNSAETVKKLKDANKNAKYETKIYERGGHGTALFEVGLQDLLEEFLMKNLQ